MFDSYRAVVETALGVDRAGLGIFPMLKRIIRTAGGKGMFVNRWRTRAAEFVLLTFSAALSIGRTGRRVIDRIEREIRKARSRD